MRYLISGKCTNLFHLQLGCRKNIVPLPLLMERGRKIIQVFMLLCSFILLLSVILPHHHHSDGRACYHPQQMEQPADSHSGDAHDCTCSGHHLFVSNAHSGQSADGGGGCLLVPLLILFDYINPLLTVACRQLPDHRQTVYVESLHGVWIAEATGLRAPPALSFLC